MSTQIAEDSNRQHQQTLHDEQRVHSCGSPHAGNVASAQVHIIIPVLNEAAALRTFLPQLCAMHASVTVVDNGSTDGSARVAKQLGAAVAHQPERGYGAACLKGIEALRDADGDDVVLFMDGDASDDLRDLPRLLAPLYEDAADLVIGSRTLGVSEQGALTPHARFGNWLATTLIAKKTGIRFTDLGPMRALRLKTLRALHMQDRGYGWTVEMQLKAAHSALRIREIPVNYRKRIGKSKISGTVSGSARAGIAILRTIALHGR